MLRRRAKSPKEKMPRKKKPRRPGRPALPNGLTEALQLRVTREGMARYEAAADASGVSLPDWVRGALDDAAGKPAGGS